MLVDEIINEMNRLLQRFPWIGGCLPMMMMINSRCPPDLIRTLQSKNKTQRQDMFYFYFYTLCHSQAALCASVSLNKKFVGVFRPVHSS